MAVKQALVVMDVKIVTFWRTTGSLALSYCQFHLVCSVFPNVSL